MSNSIDWSDPPPQQRVDQQQQKNGSDGNQSSGKLDPGVFTERESLALKQVKKNVDRTRTLGFFLGSSSVFYALTKRPPPKIPSLLARVGYSFLGGIGGAIFLMPLGVVYSKKYLKDVEDPQHMAEVLRYRVEGRRKDWEQGKLSGKPNLEAGIDPRKASGSGGTSKGRESSKNDTYGDYPPPLAVASSSRNFDSNSTSYDFNSSDNSYSNGTSNQDSDPSDSSSKSRWEQLRSERKVEPSSWERIRQDNAREALNSRNKDSYSSSTHTQNRDRDSESSWQKDESSSSGPVLADPTFGKGTNQNRDRERRSFEENMERERRGMDAGMES